tara:strand:+ start:977 stop:1270 length:294 start_codon:yes stop_codon:yes gene_type:complete
MSIKRIAIRAAVKAAKNPKIRKAVGEGLQRAKPHVIKQAKKIGKEFGRDMGVGQAKRTKKLVKKEAKRNKSSSKAYDNMAAGRKSYTPPNPYGRPGS